jgi:riboflavin biosynthesis pyrimidine reductase
MAMTADGKIAAVGDGDCSFGSRRDHNHMLELRATADAVMAGARTVDLKPVNLGPGPEKYRRLRLKNQLQEYNLRVIVSGAGTMNPQAEIFRHRFVPPAAQSVPSVVGNPPVETSRHPFDPIIVLVTGRAPKSKRDALTRAGAEVRVCGRKEIGFGEALAWLRERWNVRRLLCEGGGLLNDAMFRAGLVDELHLTICPRLLGGRDAPTICDGLGFLRLQDAPRLTLVSTRRHRDEIFLVYRRQDKKDARILSADGADERRLKSMRRDEHRR